MGKKLIYQEVKECGIDKAEEITKNEISVEVQEVIDYILKNEPDINFKICTGCGRNLPIHDWFYNNHPLGKYGKDSKCKECKSIKYDFACLLREIYFIKIKDEFINKFRFMSCEQLEKYFKLTSNEVNSLIKKLNLKKIDVINILTEEEIVFMYESLLNNEIKVFTNGIYNNDKYIVILIKYMINVILKWDRDDICNNYSLKTLKENGLNGLIGIKKFNFYKYLIKAFPEYNIMSWELKSSSTSWTDDNIKEVFQWFKNKLLENKNINDITHAGTFGFRNLLEEYNLLGLCTSKFSGNYVLLFESMYNEKFSKEKMLKDKYTFGINNNPISKNLEGKIYKITELYNELDDRGKTLVNEVIRFCELENKFPCEKDLNNKSGYICRTQFYKYFGENTLKKLYNYIIPIYDLSQEIDVNKIKIISQGQNYDAIIIKPENIKCEVCGEIKPFTFENFYKKENQKFGLAYTCKDCEYKIIYDHNLNDCCKENNIDIKDKFNIFLWYDTYLKNNLRYMPGFCYEKQNIIKIIKYIIQNKLGLLTKEKICDVNLLGRKQFEEYRIDMSIYKLGGKLFTLQKCFPELNITEEDIFKDIYTEDDMNQIIQSWITNNNLSIYDLLSKGITLTYDNKMKAMMATKFFNQDKSRMDMIIWYCKRNNLLHPIYNRDLIYWDFEEMPIKFWDNKNNRVNRVKYYCEDECEDNILNYIDDTTKLKKWIYKYFRQELLNNIVPYNKTGSLYDLLIEAYPKIEQNKILFEWEWHQYIKNDKIYLIKMLRELVIYRMNNIIVDLKQDVPIYLNQVYLKKIYPKFNKQLHKKRFNSYYEWACLSFPEYKNYWTPQMFNNNIAYDNTKCDSKEEMMVYEFIKKEMNYNYLKYIGNEKSGKYTFKLGNEYDYGRFCPDFVLEYVDFKNIKIKLDKPIYIEYYGMYCPDSKYYIYINYYNKTKIKNSFYYNNENINFIALYPDDLKNNLQGVRDKFNYALENNYNIAL